MDEFWYLATPYSGHPEGRTVAYIQATKQLAVCLANNIKVYCPIAHSHYASFEDELIGRKDDHDFWLDFDKVFVETAKGVIVTKMPGWETSKGVQWEISYAAELGKPIIYANYLEVPDLSGCE